MSGFDPINLTWGKDTYTVAPDRVMALIAVIEEHITLDELMQPGKKRAKLAAAYCAAIHFAGGRCTQEDVYRALFDLEEQERITAVIDALMMVMIPPEALRKLMAVDAAESKKKRPKTTK